MGFLRTDALTLVLVLLLCVLVGASEPSMNSNAASDPQSSLEAGSPATTEPELKTLEFFVEGFHITKKYMSMEGPQKRLPVKSALSEAGSAVWVKSMAVEILDEDRKPISPVGLGRRRMMV